MNAVISQWIGKREHQEDSYIVRHYPDATLAVVCDGMGGHEFGGLASKTAAESFIRYFESDAEENIHDRLLNALDGANDEVGRVFTEACAYGGTTLVAAYISHGVLWWVSVGDSSLYLWRQGRLLRLNEDHSMRAVYMEYVQLGCMRYEDAVRHGNTLRSAITGQALQLVDAPETPYPLLPGDRLLLTSDGTDDVLYVAAISEATQAVLNDRTQNCAAGIIRLCTELKNPYADNATVVSLDW